MTVQFKLAENKRKSKRIPPPSCFYSRHDDWRAHRSQPNRLRNVPESGREQLFALPSHFPVKRAHPIWPRSTGGHQSFASVCAVNESSGHVGKRFGKKKTVKTNDTTLRNLTTHSHLSCWKENLWNICFICGKVPTQWKSGKSETHKTEPSAKTNEKKTS